MAGDQSLPPIDVDEQAINQDWTRQTWDLPPYNSPEFLAVLAHQGLTLAEFKNLPVFIWAVARGEIDIVTDAPA